MDIYPTTQVCFVYKWTQLSTNKWYIGSHTRKDAHPNKGYICTSKIVEPMIRENPNDWVRIILETGSAKDMVALECELLTCLDAAKSEYSYNGHNGGAKFTFVGSKHSDETKSKMSKSRIGRIVSVKTRERMRLANLGKIASIETRTKISNSNKGQIISFETRSKMSDAKIGKTRPIVVCPHCSKTGGLGIMNRWHFDNCKSQSIP